MACAGASDRSVLHFFPSSCSPAPSWRLTPCHGSVICAEGGEEYWNAKWWISRVSHPQLVQLYPSPSLAASRQLAKARVDEVEACARAGGADEERLRKVVWDEVKALTEWCLEHGKRS